MRIKSATMWSSCAGRNGVPTTGGEGICRGIMIIEFSFSW